ncbi:protein-L-isoaspartate(D-aspartate) O-methyltransferase [Hydrocarboniclastica marina]|uniref:Protein-L-isoaspartate O-methyltransferase n=1 Tax=Hydrocarboniclastica marina TaxID=2259620 RepID=A0A4P7XI49_9ALTE|nr:protein-L-isoaspartate(D-aspartate) O-methyltransferase [Hydrocarboniclastica marina]MAL98905.1 protein-L-isoaspartate O-methyltransferase [Alteromonadaceae bacterium]QCF26373.1 protein-L-isoaspartate(D-aspartate) O-methyltransferase [Hydrocarboniclastica marina]|tara:strand:- start:1535 stop:2191 length:657 start_codon:yes stop_codon:yes gene_type:complete
MSAQLDGIGMTSRRTRMRLIQRLQEAGIRDTKVLDAILKTPRHIFLDEALSHRAYEDSSLPIGHGQTLSQPYIVARMTEILMQSKPSRVLELGTGSGYQTAILAQLVEQVFSVERIAPLQAKARERLRQLSLHNVSLRLAGRTMGWPEAGPYDAILVTAAPARIPDELPLQLAEGGTMIIPVGESSQMLTRVVRRGDDFVTTVLEPVRFVPLLEGVVR